MKEIALGIIDAQRGFMPTKEGDRLNTLGFGELPVNDGEAIVPNVNKLLAEYAMRDCLIFTTQDWHPIGTAHFSEDPNYTTTWPIHCVGGTPGAELHPEIIVPSITEKFKKGTEILLRGEDDQSYSGYSGINEHGERLGDKLMRLGIKQVALGGLALDYCVGKTALDLKTELGLDVVVAIDATRGIAEESTKNMLDQFSLNGIKTIQTKDLIDQLETA